MKTSYTKFLKKNSISTLETKDCLSIYLKANMYVEALIFLKIKQGRRDSLVDCHFDSC